MNYLIFSLGILLVSFCLTFLVQTEKQKRFLSCGGVIAGSVLGIIPALQVLTSGIPSRVTSLASPIPGLEVSLGLDPLSAFFLVGIYGLSGLVGIYSWGYLKDRRRLLRTAPFFPLLVATMATVVAARDGFFFLIAWEVMSLASFFLVTAEHENKEVRHAGWIYLVATHLATAFLMAFFTLLYKKTGTFSFEAFSQIGAVSPTLASLLFVLALVGFGTKAGIFPLHVWLPYAHPAAPSYISALMSGVMIKTGIYGILRALTFLGVPPLWWGELLVGLGILSAVLGVTYALIQHDLKQLLAYSSVENIGIIVTGIGLGLIGLSRNQPTLTLLGFGGSLFHVWNHAIFKGLLFLGAGNVVRVVHSRAIDQLGGLFKNMPFTGATFFIASAAICGLPPLNGFISEWLIYVGFLKGVTWSFGPSLFFSIAGIIGIAFSGGLAIACFTKVVGVVFLGEPRSEQAAIPYEVSRLILAPMVVLAFLCLAFGLYPQIIWSAVFFTVKSLLPYGAIAEQNRILTSLSSINVIFWFGLVFFLALGLLTQLIVGKRPIRRAVTWDCGYASPTQRMQYSASSFVESLGVFFAPLLKPQTDLKKPAGLFPQPGSFAEQAEDLAERRLFRPLFKRTDQSFLFVRKMQQGKIQAYLALIFVTILALLLWEVWFGI
ncbi:MAG: hypothetical protein HYT76_00515 [Deltaproteobacteria bacterium]|nr:hypothetical protein [Deltaproteobacteria bacterium]